MRSILVTLIFISFATVTASQLEEEVTVDLVEVYVSALNSKGNPVEDLTQSNFVLKEDGLEQPISYFSRLLDIGSEIPLRIAILIDTSGSMNQGNQKTKKIHIARTFASLFLREMKQGDTIQVFAFDNVYRPLTHMTSDLGVVEKALSKLQVETLVSPGTALLTSVDLTVKQIEQHFGRKILIICSDGQNNIPGPTPEFLIQTLKTHNITVLSLVTLPNKESALPQGYATQIYGNLRSPGIISIERQQASEEKRGRKLMEKLAEETGGYAVFPKNDSKLDGAIERLRSVIRSQYVLSFKPPTKKTGWREIKVECIRKGVKLHYRQGYFMI
jgi:VWFA-related protein